MKLLELVKQELRLLNYAYNTEKAYCDWIRRFCKFHSFKHPREMGAKEVKEFLADLALDKNVAASTQNQALSGLLFLYRNVFDLDRVGLEETPRAKTSKRVPVVLREMETEKVINCLSGVYKLMLSLIYGAGLRKTECLRLRVKDIDFSFGQIDVSLIDPS